MLVAYVQVGSMLNIQDRRWSTKWRARFKWIVVWVAWPTVRCHRSVTRTTTVLLTRRVSSTHMTLHSSPTPPTLSLTTPGPGGVQSFAASSKQHWFPIRRRPCVSAQYKCTYATIIYVLHNLHCNFTVYANPYPPASVRTISFYIFSRTLKLHFQFCILSWYVVCRLWRDYIVTERLNAELCDCLYK